MPSLRIQPGSPLRRSRLGTALVPVLALALAASRSHALDPHKAITQYVQTAWTDRTGLPQNSVSSIAQTNDGYLWFGTEEGLARFDGLHFTLFNTLTDKGLLDNYVSALAAGPNGALWIGTRTGLLEY